MLADLFEARVQITDIGNRVEHAFAVQEQHQPQRGVGGRMLRAEVQRPDVILLLGWPRPWRLAGRSGS